MAFVFQGNPKRFDLDDYLARYPFIYWSAPVLGKDMRIGDQVIIWRSGNLAGAVAIGQIAELPTEIRNIRYPDALGNDLWRAEFDEPSVIKVGISINEVRLSIVDGMVTRDILMDDSIFQKNRVITNPQGTVFRLSHDEVERFLTLWNSPHLLVTATNSKSALEGSIRLRQHYSRERSQYLVKQKRNDFESKHGQLKCEICGLSEGNKYPASFGTPFIEVHHRIPLSSAGAEVRTTLDDLILLCANCHRTVHSSQDVEQNLETLCSHFGVRI